MPFKVGLIGCGFMGRMHAQVYARLADQATVKVVCAKEVAVANELAAKLSASVTTRWEEVVHDPELNVVDICLPTYLHAEVSIAALRAGKDVFCEKPMALTAAEGKAMVAATKETGRRLMIGHCIRFWNEYAHLYELIQNKSLGRLTSLNLTRYGQFPAWSSEGWLGDEKLAGGGALDMHIHDTDFALHALGEPQSIRSSGTVDSRGVSHIFTTMDYKDAVVQSEGGWNLPLGTPFKMTFRAIFERGAAIFDGGPLTIYHEDGSKVIPKFDSMLSGEAGGNISDLGGYYHELNYFYTQLSSGGNLEMVTPESALRSLEVTLREIELVKAGS